MLEFYRPIGNPKRMQFDGHLGLSNRKITDAANGELIGALSYLELDQHTANYVIHVYSNVTDPSLYLQRSVVGGSSDRANFIERLGFAFCDTCNVLSQGRCYYKVIDEVRRESFVSASFQHMLRTEATICESFKKFMANIKEIYNLIFRVDEMLLDAGIELPWEDLKLSPRTHRTGEKLYEKGQIYDFYKDIGEITEQAKNEIFLVDTYPDEEVLNLYLDKVPTTIKIRILANKPQGNFVAVAQKFKAKSGVNFEVRTSTDSHDRLFFIDNSCWVMGQSLKDAGRQPIYLVRIESHDLFKKLFEDLWLRAQALV